MHFRCILLSFLSIFQIIIVFSDPRTNVDRQLRFSQSRWIGCGIQKVHCRNAECNSNQNARIIGGTETFRGEHPWMVLLTTSNARNQFCAGTILDQNHLLTANHCVYDVDIMKLARLRIILGDFDIRTWLDGIHEERRVSKVFSHPKWNPQTNENDIAILKLRKPVNFTNYIQPICLGSGVNPQNILENEVALATIVGWGRKNIKTKQKSAVPLKAIVPLRNHKECRKGYLPFLVSDKMLCAGGAGKDACLGDSGGPLLIKNVESERWEQIGIISWGNSCVERPGVFTRISSYREWILETLQTSYSS